MASGVAARRRHALVILLTFNAGATDAIGLLALGGAFTSVMTGNLVLLGTAAASGDAQLAGRTLAAVGCFVLGCGLGARIAGTATPNQPVWPRQVTCGLAIELAMFGGYAAGWWATGSHPVGRIQLLLLSATAIGLGVQSSSVQRFGVSGLSTTYMTGTLTTLVVRLTSGHAIRDVADSMQLLGALVSGAIVAALLWAHAPVFLPVVQLASLAIVIIGAGVSMPAGSRQPQPYPRDSTWHPPAASPFSSGDS
jgi:uncharacterized membrane protein YoaK (UPF0700 family)